MSLSLLSYCCYGCSRGVAGRRTLCSMFALCRHHYYKGKNRNPGAQTISSLRAGEWKVGSTFSGNKERPEGQSLSDWLGFFVEHKGSLTVRKVM